MKTRKDYTERQRQKAGDLLVHREVHACVSSLVDELMKAHLLDDDLGFDPSEFPGFTFHACPECGGAMEEDENEDGDSIWVCEYEGCKHSRQEEEPDLESLEIYEWWIVDGFLASNLQANGEFIYNDYGPAIWGRCTTGQAIALDHVIQDIALGLDWIRKEVEKC